MTDIFEAFEGTDRQIALINSLNHACTLSGARAQPRPAAEAAGRKVPWPETVSLG